MVEPAAGRNGKSRGSAVGAPGADLTESLTEGSATSSLEKLRTGASLFRRRSFSYFATSPSDCAKSNAGSNDHTAPARTRFMIGNSVFQGID